jgi:hypothetical protein
MLALTAAASKGVRGDTVLALTGIAGWRDNPVTGNPEPEWEGSTEIVWSGQRPAIPETPYRCRNCSGYFAAHELHREPRAPYPAEPIDRRATPIARIVIVMANGRPQVICADAPVSAVVIERDALRAEPSALPIGVEVQGEYVASVFAGQS